jgi:GTP pyrophosphokinase
VIARDLSALNTIEFSNTGRLDPDTLANILLGSVHDVRSLICRLARRMETLRYLDQFPNETVTLQKLDAQSMAQNTLSVYAPICHKLGLYSIKWELEDLAFKILEPEAYEKIKSLVHRTRREREDDAHKIAQEIEEILAKNNLDANVVYRVKHFYSIHKKMKAGKPFEKIYDLLAVRILCNTVKKCYEALGILHGAFIPRVSEFSDYISKPKPNGYQSIHTVLEKNGGTFEAQIRTWGMHYNAESGIAAHWQYKQYRESKFFDKNLSWAKHLLSWQQSFRNTREFMGEMNKQFADRLFVLTPKNHVLVLPAGSTVLDFAFAIHSDLGLHCHQAKINGKTMPLFTRLSNADRVEINGSKTVQAKRSWLTHVVSDKALQRLRGYLGIHAQGGKGAVHAAGSRVVSEGKTRLARCCNPVHGDSIVGVRTTKRKIVIHRRDCETLEQVLSNKRVDMDWGTIKEAYPVRLTLDAIERPDLLSDIMKIVNENRAKMLSSQTKIHGDRFRAELEIEIKDKDQIERILGRLGKVPNVQRVKRA